jgi:hypothetical protein
MPMSTTTPSALPVFPPVVPLVRTGGSALAGGPVDEVESDVDDHVLLTTDHPAATELEQDRAGI